jgi:hypothetical protein
MKVSYVVVTRNRRDALLKTLAVLKAQPPLQTGESETWVVDNASTDGTPQAVAARFPAVNIIRRPSNEGVWSRGYAFAPARGQYIVLLDDDSYPVDDAIARSVDYLDRFARCGAVYGKVMLPDGATEACALPTVLISCAACIRKSAIQKAGSFRREFFRKAGEYDFSFRVWEAGYSIERFDDVIYRHDKVTSGRSAALAHRLDLRNNLILVERYFPASLRGAYRADWTLRYTALARHAGHGGAARLGRAEARLWRARERWNGRQTLSAPVIERVLEIDSQASRISAWARDNFVRDVVIADFGKNIYATWQGCGRAGLRVRSVADSNPAFGGLRYRGAPVITEAQAMADAPDGIVVSNINPAQVERIAARLRSTFTGPILTLWRSRPLGHTRRAA